MSRRKPGRQAQHGCNKLEEIKVKTRSGQILLAAALAIAGLKGGAAHAQTLEYGNYQPPAHPSNVYALEPMFRNIEEKSGGDLRINLHPGGSLVGGKDTLSGIETGLVDGGFIVSIYYPNELPLTTTISDLAMLMRDPVVMAGALNETVLLDCPACLEEYQGRNVTYLGSYATTPYVLMCKQPVRTLADVKGLKIRSAGEAYGRWIIALGGVPVTIPNSESYEAMQRGQLDCIHGPISYLKTLSVWDVAKHVLHQDMGAFGGGALLAFNSDTWDGLGAEEKAYIVDEVPGALARLAVGYMGEDDLTVEQAPEHGVTIYESDPEIAALLVEQQKSEFDIVVAKAAERGAKGADELARAFLENLEKWSKIADGIRGDAGLVEEALRREIYSKLDW